jgi:cation transport ATPase
MNSHETVLRVKGMDCAEEVAAIQRALRPISGVRDVRTNLLAGKTSVSHDASVTPEALIKAIAGEGLKATIAAADVRDAPEEMQKSRLISVLISGVCTGLV